MSTQEILAIKGDKLTDDPITEQFMIGPFSAGQILVMAALVEIGIISRTINMKGKLSTDQVDKLLRALVVVTDSDLLGFMQRDVDSIDAKLFKAADLVVELIPPPSKRGKSRG